MPCSLKKFLSIALRNKCKMTIFSLPPSLLISTITFFMCVSLAIQNETDMNTRLYDLLILKRGVSIGLKFHIMPAHNSSFFGIVFRIYGCC